MAHHPEKLSVPTDVNSANNNIINDVIGRKDDTEAGDSLYAIAYTLKNHIHSMQKVYPTGAPGVLVTSGVGAWTLGAFAEIVPASTITSPFDIHHVFLTDISAQKDYELVLYQGASDVEVARIKFQGIAGGKIDHMPVQTPLIAANARIRTKVMDTDGGATVKIALAYHVY